SWRLAEPFTIIERYRYAAIAAFAVTAIMVVAQSSSGGHAWMVAVPLGAAAALAVPFGLYFLNNTIGSAEDAARISGFPCLGRIPAARSHQRYPLLNAAPVPYDFADSF